MITTRIFFSCSLLLLSTEISSFSVCNSVFLKETGVISRLHMSGGKFSFSIDRGGTFTDVHCILPDGREVVRKLLSDDPDNYADAPTEGIRRILAEFDKENPNQYKRNEKLNTSQIASIRMGTTVATNALLERKGERMGLLITKGFKDLLRIGDQSRQDIFDLTCAMPELLYEDVKEVDERVMLADFFDRGKTKEDIAAYSNHIALNDGGLPQVGYGPRIQGISGETVIPLKVPDMEDVRKQLQDFADSGIKSVAIVLAHSYTYNKHEIMIGELAKEMGCFSEISMSSAVIPMVKIVNRGHTAW